MPPLLAPCFALLGLGAALGDHAAPGLMVAIAAGALVPDIDLLLLLVSPTAAVRWHRGPTHTFAGLIVLGVLAGLGVTLAAGPSPRVTIPMALAGVFVHAVFDALSTQGLAAQLLRPGRRLALGWMIPTDPVTTGIAVVGLLFALGFPGAGRIVSLSAMGLILYLVGIRAFARRRAHDRARQAVATPIEGVYPRPESPMRWTVVTRTAEGLEAFLVDLGRRRLTRLESFPEASADAGTGSSLIREVVRAATYPVLRSRGATREIRDLRFAYDWPVAPFGADVELDAAGAPVRERVYL